MVLKYEVTANYRITFADLASKLEITIEWQLSLMQDCDEGMPIEPSRLVTFQNSGNVLQIQITIEVAISIKV